jgi:hypothetical protein
MRDTNNLKVTDGFESGEISTEDEGEGLYSESL